MSSSEHDKFVDLTGRVGVFESERILGGDVRIPTGNFAKFSGWESADASKPRSTVGQQNISAAPPPCWPRATLPWITVGGAMPSLGWNIDAFYVALLVYALFPWTVELVSAHSFDNSTFIGQRLWDELDQKRCDFPAHYDAEPKSLFCFVHFKRDRALWTKIEVVNWSPLLMILRHLIADHELEQVRGLTNDRRMQTTKVIDDDIRKSKMHESRQANGTWVKHQDDAVVEIFRRAQRVTGFNLDLAEDWQLLKYIKGGHYVPHYDYLDVPPNPMDYDSWMRHLGNRMATLLLILERAEEGGGTIFPYLSLTVRPEPGDGILWFNMNVDGTRDDGTLHGGCPIRAGTKLAMTLWIREKGQELRVKCPRFPYQMRFDLSSLALW